MAEDQPGGEHLGLCPYCEETVLREERALGHVQPAHVECVLRAVMGSVAHLQKRCSCYVPGSTEDDPPGLSKREAARAAVKLWHEMHQAAFDRHQRN